VGMDSGWSIPSMGDAVPYSEMCAACSFTPFL
jgi:hypothetical protein